jgi:hypothetical protein
MDRFEYEITRHTADSFREITYFCSETGDCRLEEVPTEQAQIMVGILNTRGLEGWELIQMNFGKDGVLAWWKRRMLAADTT